MCEHRQLPSCFRPISFPPTSLFCFDWLTFKCIRLKHGKDQLLLVIPVQQLWARLHPTDFRMRIYRTRPPASNPPHVLQPSQEEILLVAL